MNSEPEIRDHQDPEREPRDYQSYGREIRDYLLGSLPEERREKIEQQFLSDDDFHLEVEIVEEELFDDYLLNKLPEPDHRRFEVYFLASPLRRQRLQFARAFHEISLKAEIPVTPALPLSARSFTARLYPYTLAACFLVLAVLGTRDYQLSRSVQEEHDKAVMLALQLENAGRQITMPFPAASSTNSIFWAPLVPRGSRSGSQPQLIVPKDILALHFGLTVPANFRAPVRIDLLNDAGQSIFSQQGAQVERDDNRVLVSALIEARYLPPGDYLLRLTPQDSSSFPEYAFQLLRPSQPLKLFRP